MKSLRNESGQALVEMALVLPILILLFLGIVEMTMIGFTYITIQNAVSAGGNVAVSGGSDTQVKTAITNAAPGLTALLLTSGTVITHASPNVTIKVTYPVNLIVSVIPGLSNPFNVVATLTEEVP